MVSFERVMLVSYRISIVIIASSLTILPQFAIECLGLSKQQWVGHLTLGQCLGKKGWLM